MRSWFRSGHDRRYPWRWLGVSMGVAVGWNAAIDWTAPARALNGAHCPQTLRGLMAQMLPDLPSYINRVRTRAGLTKSFITLAAQPEFDPLPLPGSSATPQASADVQQVFFTTLLRRYEGQTIQHLQEYHWLFLARSPQPPASWQVVLLYSTFGAYPATGHLPLPPRNSSDGSTATAIRQWLADCQMGQLPRRLQPPKPQPSKP